jgi:hypothetical protein
MSGVNPYVTPTCPSPRNCKNHKYNTEGLFTGFYNENSSIHCGQQHIKMPFYQKATGGTALPDSVYVNVSPGEQLVANNGVEYTDIQTESSMAALRTGFVDAKAYQTPSLTAAGRLGGRSKPKEGFANTEFVDYSTKPNGLNASNVMTSSTAVTPLMENIEEKKKEGAAEKFCSACASPAGCTVLAIVIAALVIWLCIAIARRFMNKSGRVGSEMFSYDRYDEYPSSGRRTVTWGGKYTPSQTGSVGTGNMNLSGGNSGASSASAVDTEFSVI